MSFKPMLAPNEKTDVTKIVFPVLGSPKLDGVRAVMLGGRLVSRNLKPIPNKFVQRCFAGLPNGIDGELICGEPNEDPYRRTISAVMSEDGEPEVTFFAFDFFENPVSHASYKDRYDFLRSWIAVNPVPYLTLLPHVVYHNLEELLQAETLFLDKGFEGMMIRSLDGPYKQGRATQKQAWLLKIKRWEDAEAVILDFEERMHNGNEATTNLLGRTERSSHKDGLSGRGDLGAIRVRGLNGPYAGVEFNIGSGFNDAERKDLWIHRPALIGQTVKYKYFPTGSKDKPRFPGWLGFRDKADM